MNPENTQRRSEEIERRINQVEDPITAETMAEIEKPIRDLSRNEKTNPEIRKLKPLLDKEAERIAENEIHIKQELLKQPVTIIKLSRTRATNSFYTTAKRSNIQTIEDLTKTDIAALSRGYWMSEKIAKEVEAWLLSHGLSLSKNHQIL